MDLQLGLVPVVDDDATRRALGRIAENLARAVGSACHVHCASNPAALGLAFETGTVNVVWSSPTLTLGSPTMRRSVPVVTCVRQGVAHYHGVLFVRRDSMIRSVLDLKGRKAAWVAPTSASGYIFPRVALAGHGLDPMSLFVEERFVETHGAVVSAVLDGDADVGATFAVFEEGDALKPMVRAGFVDLGRSEEARVLLATPRIPSDLFVASQTLHAQLGDRLARGLQQVCAELPIPFTRVFGAEMVLPTAPEQHAELRRQLEDARAMGIME